jgi:divalent metal cation (Fe/Co/Zn/Cd) transporter
MNTVTPMPISGDIRAALRLETLTIGWMVIEASASIGAGVVAGSVLLLAFGVDSIIELISAGVLFYRLRKEANGTANAAEIEALEHRAARIAGYLLYALAAYVVLQSGYGLLHRHTAETSGVGLAVALVAALGMPVLARAKIRVADRIGSKALRADAMETFTCGFLSWILLAGLAANALLHWWWLDGVVALVLVPFLIKEGREAMKGGCRCGAD